VVSRPRDPDLESPAAGSRAADPGAVRHAPIADPAPYGAPVQTADPGLGLVFVYDAGHAIAAERPEAFTEVVSDFLDRHDAFVSSVRRA
jgi:hypothetical protein